jgi:hypothetical protein
MESYNNEFWHFIDQLGL